MTQTPNGQGDTTASGPKTLTVTLSADQWRQLHEMATLLGIDAEDLVRLSVKHLLAGPEDTFPQAIAYLLKEKMEIRRRLA